MNKKGFTLLEMTIVILIISILFLLVIPNIKKIVSDKGCKALEKIADSAIIQYKLEYDSYPSSVSDLINAGLLTEQQITCDGEKSLVISDGHAYIE